MRPTDETTIRTSHDNEQHLHVVVTEPATGELLDFELLPLPLTVNAIQQALSDLRERHLRRTAAAEHRTVDQARERRREVERHRHEEMVQRLQSVAPLWDVSPHRPVGGEQGSRS